MSLRPARAEDAVALSDIHRRVALLPPEPAEDLRFMRETLLATTSVWVAEADGAMIGYVAFDGGWIRHLMVHPDHQGQGHGARLLAHAMADGRARQLWTYARNARARRFYEAHGWVLAEVTDGREDAHGEAEVRYVSQG
ncbi:MAG: GNAT family N-acetyltransferase [Proteobacteria bacterium]|nr:GNAT family N-acetyltransferase [Pseudomonadota bacterium]